MSLKFTSRILALLKDEDYRPVTLDKIAEQLGVEPQERAELQTALDALISKKTVALTKDRRIQLPAAGDFLTGTIKIHPKGFAFVVPEAATRGGDIFVPAGETSDAVSGDRVRVRILPDHRRGKSAKDSTGVIGRVDEILERGRKDFVGTLVKRERTWLVEIDNRALHVPVVVRDVGAKGAREGDKVVVELLQYPEDNALAEGVIVERLGVSGKPDVETTAVIRSYELPGEFPPEALAQARNATADFARLEVQDRVAEDRLDLRDRFILTIDPPDAKDFDDAISLTQNKDGSCELGLHIADASHFVTPDSPLDVEARDRANSVYLPRLVIPMLPEVLSNGVCSLQESVDRFTKSVFVTLDSRGHVIGRRFANTVIRSAKRLTYLEAEALIHNKPDEARKHAISERDYPKPLIPTLQAMSRLAGLIRKRRLDAGMIVLGLPEVDLIFDDQGHVTGAQPEDNASTHGLIEMFMVEANEAVAALADRLLVPLLRRTHPDPSTLDFSELRRFCRVAGINIPTMPTRAELQSILKATAGTPRQHAIHLAVLKSMTRAEYSPALIGHFALASEHYAHFTSPIRRYPDLLVHRVLQAYLEATDNGATPPSGRGWQKLGQELNSDPRCLSEDALVEIGRHCGDRERNADMAERSLRIFLVLQLIERKHQGDILEGVVVDISSNAIFVQLKDYLIDGVIAVKDLNLEGFHRASRSAPPPKKGKFAKHPKGKSKSAARHSGTPKAGRWTLNPQTGALVNEATHQTIQVGDILPVQVTRVDPSARRLDLRPVARD